MSRGEAAVTATTLDLDSYLLQLPKVDLHCHLLGTVQAKTFGELARRAGLELPESPETIFASINSFPPDPELYRNTRIPMPTGLSDIEPENSYSLFKVSEWVREVVRTEEDLTRITYEAFEEAHKYGTWHLEMSFDELPEHFVEIGYDRYVDAMAQGIRKAEKDFGMTGCLLAAIDRSRSGEEALAWVQTVTGYPHEYVAGIGLDNLENSGAPEKFVAAYALAGQFGLKKTAHTSEHVPSAQNAITCIEDLQCDRLDHGYFILEDDDVIAQVKESGIALSCASTTSRRSWRPWRTDSILAMLDAGLNVLVASDDPGMFPTTLVNEYRILAERGVSKQKLTEMARAGFEASWLSEPEKAAVLVRFDEHVAGLNA
ncbi:MULTISPECIES: adenosine deaminase family protein [Arthrobacter]|uniref:adenosine deaminase family protein n=1 Tax=Arthrobacter TaxID=1663 RepID=UPI00185DD91C|nr:MULTISPECIES: hypothetical protein [Arthrobacter]NYG17755.1 adenosine deaminase [Arthrobacter psychrochitiniphilus]